MRTLLHENFILLFFESACLYEGELLIGNGETKGVGMEVLQRLWYQVGVRRVYVLSILSRGSNIVQHEMRWLSYLVSIFKDSISLRQTSLTFV
jgi:hypothetical protein